MGTLEQGQKKKSWPLICYAGSAGRNLDRSTTDRLWIHVHPNRIQHSIQECFRKFVGKNLASQGFVTLSQPFNGINKIGLHHHAYITARSTGERLVCVNESHLSALRPELRKQNLHQRVLAARQRWENGLWGENGV